MNTQTPQVINVQQSNGITKPVTLPEEGDLIQTVIKKSVGDTIIPTELCVKEAIKRLHERGENAYLILTAAIIPKPVSTSGHFHDACQQDYKYHVVSESEIRCSGLMDRGRVQKEANDLRNAGERAASERKKMQLVA